MLKEILLLTGVLGFAGNAWAVLGDPYIGQTGPYTGAGFDWSTSSKVTATAGSRTGDWQGWDVSRTAIGKTVDGSGVLNFVGTSPPDGQYHTPGPLDASWVASYFQLTGLANPAGRPGDLGWNGAFSQNWIAFTFDQPYNVKDIDIWNGAYATGEGGGADYSLRNVYIDYKVNGVWQLAGSTIELARCPNNGGNWFTPTDNIAVGLNGVEAVCITPLDNWTIGSTSSYAAFSEVRFYLIPEPSTLALLGLGGLALFLRRKS
jgi:hypothetical protein